MHIKATAFANQKFGTDVLERFPFQKLFMQSSTGTVSSGMSIESLQKKKQVLLIARVTVAF
jgi:hypothetical protein